MQGAFALPLSLDSSQSNFEHILLMLSTCSLATVAVYVCWRILLLLHRVYRPVDGFMDIRMCSCPCIVTSPWLADAVQDL